MQNCEATPSNRWSFWLSILPAFGILYLSWQGVILSGDDVLYARLAAEAASGSPLFGVNTHTYRIGFIFPMAVSYKIFGINDFSTLIPAVLSSILMIALSAFAANRLFGKPAGVFAAYLCALNPILFRNGTTAMADIPAGFFFGLFVVGWVLLATDRVKNRAFWGFVTGVASVWSVSTRISTAPMMLLLWAFFFLFAWRDGSLGRLPYVSMIAGALMVGLPYLFCFWWYTGNPLFFIQAAQSGYNLPGAPWVDPYQGGRFWFRISGLSALRASVEGFFFGTFPILLSLLFINRSGLNNKELTALRCFLAACLVPVAILSHFSTSFTRWTPVQLDLRFGSPVIIPSAILVGWACIHLYEYWSRTRIRVVVAAALLFCFALTIRAVLSGDEGALAGGIVSMVMAGLICWDPAKIKRILPYSLVLLLLFNFISYRIAEYPNLVSENRKNRHEGSSLSGDVKLPVLADSVTGQYLPYLNAFHPDMVIETWKPAGAPSPLFLWVPQRDRAWDEPYLIAWYPWRAYASSNRFGGKVPEWVLSEVRRGERVVKFSDEKREVNPFDHVKLNINADLKWPAAGIYRIAKQ